MFDTAGRLLENFIKPSLTDVICVTGNLPPKQYGFRAGLSTIDAIEERALFYKTRKEPHEGGSSGIYFWP